MLLNKDILPIIIAGLMNGSFVVPSKFIKSANSEKIWLWHSVIGILILPWIILFLSAPETLSVYFSLSIFPLLLIIFAGLIFGMAQIYFIDAIKRIGIALAFSINIGVGIALGSMFPVFLNHEFFSRRGLMVTCSIILVLFGLLVNYLSGKNNHCRGSESANNYHLGWFLALLAGLAGGLQNITFFSIAFYDHAQKLKNVNPFWIWPLFLLASSIPMCLGFYAKFKKAVCQQSITRLPFVSIKNVLLLFLMGFCFTGSLWLYTWGMRHLAQQDRIIGWPIFMTLIILPSLLWGVVYKETALCFSRATTAKLGSVLLLLIAVTLLGIFT